MVPVLLSSEAAGGSRDLGAGQQVSSMEHHATCVC